MKKLTILLILFPIWINAQNISVKSFKILTNDMDARISFPKQDQNGDKCAIIKMVTTQKGFVFDGGMMGIVTTEYKTGEYWIYLPWGSKTITLKHDKLGVLRNYVYPIPIKEATVYEMVLTTGTVVTTVVNNEIPMQWLAIASTPTGADVYINDKLIGTTPYQKKMEIGKYTYRIEQYMYHNTAGVITLTEDKKERIDAALKPNFGYAKIITTPENGAKIEIDKKPVNGVTPLTTEKLLGGKHTIKVKKAMYKNRYMEFEITDGQTTNLTIPLDADFATVTIQTNPVADIYVDDERKGTGTYTGRLMEGLHNFEAKKDKYTSDKKQYEFLAGQIQTISLHPIAKTGTVDIMTTPFDANIKIDGKQYGITPNTVKNLLIGNYTLTLTKTGFGTVTKNITITQNQTITVNETLPSGKQITINSNPSEAAIYIDGTAKGTTPYTETLSFGNHKLKLINGKKIVEQNITISQNGKSSWSFDVQEFSIEMIFVKGGTFKMGSNESSDEKPIHTVTVNDFYIGKYEVTQKQWKAIMGSNPSNFKGDNLPVEQVSWNDVQQFIKKLNQKTGKKYRLPTEAEWEYAAKGGNKTKGYKYSGSNNINNVAWYSSNSGNKTHPVGTKQANELGIYDMTGNVWEWCSDWYGSSYYSSSPQNNPQGPSSGSYRVFRGGSWYNFASNCRSAIRSGNDPTSSYSLMGFRLAYSQ